MHEKSIHTCNKYLGLQIQGVFCLISVKLLLKKNNYDVNSLDPIGRTGCYILLVELVAGEKTGG